MKDRFLEVLIAYFVVGMVIGFITGWVFKTSRIVKYPEESYPAKTLLNSGKYTIDTTMVIHNQDTTYKYKFIKLSEQ